MWPLKLFCFIFVLRWDSYIPFLYTKKGHKANCSQESKIDGERNKLHKRNSRNVARCKNEFSISDHEINPGGDL